MQPRPRRHLRTRLIAAFLAPMLVTLVVGTAVWYWLARQALEEELGLRLIAVAQAAAAGLPVAQVTALVPGDEESRTYRRIKRDLERLRRATGVSRLFVVSLERTALIDTEPGVLPGATLHRLAEDRAELARVFRGRPAASLLFTGRDGALYKTGYAPLADASGRAVAAVGADGSAAFFEVLADVRDALVLVGLVGAALVVLTGLLVAGGITRPLNRLVSAARAIGRGRLDQHVPHEGKDEIAFLGRTLEEMRAHLAERDQRMQMMLSGIAHEIRNPLGGIDLFTGLLADELESDEKLCSHVGRIRQELSALTRIVNDFLDYARPSRLDRSDVNPHELMQEVVDLVGGDIDERGVRIEIDMPDGCPDLHVDPELLRRALLNLVLNAVQAVEPGGAVRLGVRPDPDGGVILEVEDDGQGIEPDKLSEVFKAFYTTRAQGTGLGLALARKIVEEHRGEIEINSEVDRGTHVRIHLPG